MHSSISVRPCSAAQPFPAPSYLDFSSHRARLFTDFYPPPSLSDSPTPRQSSSHLPLASTLGFGFSTSSSPSSSRPPYPMAIALPLGWDPKDCCPSLSVDSDSRTVRFVGNSGDRDAAAVRANNPMPRQAGVYYFELDIISKGQLGYIGIGFSVLGVSLTRLPGWEHSSWGYHGDDGHAFSSQTKGQDYGPTFTTGDVVGCGIDWTVDNGRAFYTKNGLFLGYVFQDLVSSGHLYPSVGLKTQGEAVKANFGQEPFKFDIESFVRSRKADILKEIETAVIPKGYLPSSETKGTLTESATLASTGQSSSAPTFKSSKEASENVTAAKGKTESESQNDTADKGNDSSTDAESNPDPNGVLSIQKVAQGMIAGWLEFHGYSDTARSFDKQCAQESRMLCKRASRKRNTQSDRVEFSIENGLLDEKIAGKGKGKGRDTYGATGMDVDDENADKVVRESLIPSGRISNNNNNRIEEESEYDDKKDEDEDEGEEEDVDDDGVLNRSDIEMRRRDQIKRYIIAGQIDQVIELIETHYPSLVNPPSPEDGSDHHNTMGEDEKTNQNGKANGHVTKSDQKDGTSASAENSSPSEEESLADTMIILRCRKFVELVLAAAHNKSAGSSGDTGSDDEDLGSDSPQQEIMSGSRGGPSASTENLETALTYGRELRELYGNDSRPHVQKTMRDAFSLLAYANPSDAGGEVAWLASMEAREMVASRVNSAILASQGKAARPALEVTYRHGMSLLEELWRSGSGKAALVTMEDVLEALA